MPFASVKLIPGVDTEKTPTLAEANYVATQLCRFRDGLVQKLGGWEKFYPLSVSGVPKALHAWQDLNETGHLGVGTTSQLSVVTSGVLSDITPQTLTSNFAAAFTIVGGQSTVFAFDPNISNVTVYDSVFFSTPVSVGGIILSGWYKISLITGTNTYAFESGQTAAFSDVNTGTVPDFGVTSGSATVTVTLLAHGVSVGDFVSFAVATTVGGITVSGVYAVNTVPTANTFTITGNVAASSTATAGMNGAQVQLLYYIALGPAASGVGYGVGTYGTGTYGIGIVPTAQTGTPVTSVNWQLDNYGSLFVAVRRDGGFYTWSPTDGFYTAQLVDGAPVFNTGGFVSGQAPILIGYGCSQEVAIGEDQDALLWRNSAFEDFSDWTETTTNQARRARIPTGSRIVGGIAGPKYDHLWTDVDFWTLNYVGFPLVFDTQPTATACGLIAQHAVVRFREAMYWMGRSNFFIYAGGGVQIIPCSVWDAVFQNINLDQADKVHCGSNTPFNEIWWFYPSTGQTECDKYAKYNVTEGTWDIGDLARTSWIDQSVLGNPIASVSTGLIYQHEEGYDADGSPMTVSFTTGYTDLAEGEDFLFIDRVLPDMRWGTYPGNTGAQLSVTFHLVDYPGDTPRDFGPYDFSKSTQYISTRMRGRQAAMTVSSADSGSFWRLGVVRFQYSADGRR